SLTGPLTIESGGVLNIAGTFALENVLTNAGTVTMTGAASLSVENQNNSPPYQGAVYNLAGGLWDIQTNANINCYFCGTNEVFNNAGVFRKSGGSSTSVGITFNNTGTANALVGTLSFSGSFTTSGGTLA